MTAGESFSRGYRPCTLQEALDDQRDLAELCAEREFETCELFLPNAYYGFDQVIKGWAGLPPDRPLKVALPHGVEYTATTNISRREPVPVTGYYAEGYDRVYRDLGARQVWPMASPIAYLAEHFRNGTPPPREGTIVFPSHSGLGAWKDVVVRARFDVESMIERLLALPAEYQPITVCSYWVDRIKGYDEPFARHGMRIVSAGHMADRQFLPRLYHLCSTHRYAASNDVGSQAFYAVKAGCSYFHLDAEVTWENWDRPIGDEDRRYAETRQLVRGFASMDREQQLEAADRYLGTAHLLPPDELRALLLRAERLDRWGATLVPAPGRHRLAVTGPWFLRRTAHRAAKLAARALSRGRRR